MSIFKTVSFSLLLAPVVLGGCAQNNATFEPGGVTLTGAEDATGLANHDTGRSHFEAGRYGLAIRAFESAVDTDPGSIDSLNGLAASYDKIGRYDLAERYYRQALSVDPDNGQTLNNLGYSYLLQGKYDLAVVYLREAQRFDQTNTVIVANKQTAEDALQSVGWSERGRTAPVAPVESADLTAESKLWIERTSAEVQTLRVPGAPESEEVVDDPATAAKVTVRSGVAEGAAQTAAQTAARPEDGEDPQPDPNPAPRAAVIGIVTRPVGAVTTAALPPRDLEHEAPATKAAAAPVVDLGQSVIEVSNGTGRSRMAARMQSYLGEKGVSVDTLSNAAHFRYQESVVYYQPGFEAEAQALVDVLPLSVGMEESADQAANLRVRLGGDLLDFDRELYYTMKDWKNEA